jgi:PAS domain S-box-containing protein
MKDENKTKKQLINELIESRKQITGLQKSFNKFKKTADDLEKESANVSMELAISLSEVFEALRKISSGDPEVSISEESEVELISQLKHMVNITAKNIAEIVDQSHEFAVSLAEQFDVLKRVSKGDLKARVSGISRVELLELLKGVTNGMIESVSRAEEDLRRSEKRYRTVFENTGAATVIVEEGMISLANREFERLTGYSKEEIQRRKRWTEFVADDDRERMEEYYRKWVVDPNSVPGSCECRLADRRGNIKDVFVTMAIIPGTRIGVASLLNITERKKAAETILKINRTLKVLSKCNEILFRSRDEMELLNTLCRIIVKLGGYRMCGVGYAEYGPSSPLLAIAHAGCDDYFETLKEAWSRKDCDQRPECSTIRTGKMIMCNNIMTDPQFEHLRGEAVKCGYTSVIVLPLAENSGSFGVLVIYASEPDAFDREETDLLAQLADNLAYGIISLRTRAARRLAEEALKKNEAELKKRVKELEEFYDVAVGRELRMKELKEEIESLKEELEKYKKPLP